MLARTLERTRAWKKQQSKLLAKIADGTIASVNERENDDEEDAAVEADRVTDEWSRVEEEVLDDQQSEIDADFVNMFPVDDAL